LEKGQCTRAGFFLAAASSSPRTVCGGLFLAAACQEPNRPPVPPSWSPYLAARYPCDQGIAGDPAVVLAEKVRGGLRCRRVTGALQLSHTPFWIALSRRPSSVCGAVFDSSSPTVGINQAKPQTCTSASTPDKTNALSALVRDELPGGVPGTTRALAGGYNPRATGTNPQRDQPQRNDRVSFCHRAGVGQRASNPAGKKITRRGMNAGELGTKMRKRRGKV